MRTRATGSAWLAGVLLGGTLMAAPIGAQAVDSTLRWSLFGGTVLTPGTGLAWNTDNLALGGSADFRWRRFPLPLRATLSVSQSRERLSASRTTFGAFSLDAVGHPLPRFLGTRLYLLGGLGAGTRGAFMEGGTGLEIGKAFIEWKLQVPVASDGYRRAPISIGFRF